MLIFSRKCISLALGGLALLVPAQAEAVTITVNAGPVTAISSTANPYFDFTQFMLGEDLIVQATFDPTPAANQVDDSSSSSRGRFIDPLGIFTVTGVISGASLQLSPGVEIEFINRSNGTSAFDLESPHSEPTAAIPLIIDDDIDFDFAVGIFTDPNDLLLSLDEFLAVPSSDLFSTNTGSNADVEFFDGDAFGTNGLKYGPAVNIVPLPATLPLLLTGLAVFGLVRRCRTAA